MLIRILFIIIGCIATGFGAFAHWQVGMRGFPDGHIPEVDRVLVPYDFAFAYILLAVGLWTIIHAIRCSNVWPFGVWWGALALIGVMVWARVRYEAYLATFLMTGTGG